MFKEFTIIICIILAVIGGNIFSQNYTKNSVEMVTQKIEELSEILINTDDKELMKEKHQDILDTWESRFKILAYYIEHDELEKVKTELVILGANIEVEEYEKGLEELEKCKYILEHIEEKEEFSLMNVF